ncbi:hypothetical protein IC006_2547 [Sulfuracidifex tepidarius]|uniref:S-formylglutathione hydrolase n=1 Tax=Sulfuracidifex tepidarius TaxID=1294262 RepID=A0A510DYA3_9CREN|nr:alpha/beta hydrolase-fold protein [Sulfuracidifex tepidarius]BBG25212.1 hypothetical protein IC006_2547 [Sulfuracidifex tepidarius]
MNLKLVEFESESLKDNPLKDPYKRKVAVIEPENPQGKPLIIYLSGFLSSSLSMLNYDPFSEDMKTRLERMKAEGKSNGVVMVLPDTFTKMGGNQYLNSSAVGNYEDYVMEVVKTLSETYKTDKIGIMGKSSGGYGSVMIGMKHKEIRAIADHSGDAYFEYIYIPEFPVAIERLGRFSSWREWFTTFWNRETKKRRDELTTLMILAMSAFYSPRGEDVELPFSLETGEIVEDVWKRWVEKDPVRALKNYVTALREKEVVYIDVGKRDEYNIQYGSRIIHSILSKSGVDHVYEEFDGGHHDTSFRYDYSIAILEKYLNDGEKQ